MSNQPVTNTQFGDNAVAVSAFGTLQSAATDANAAEQRLAAALDWNKAASALGNTIPSDVAKLKAAQAEVAASQRQLRSARAKLSRAKNVLLYETPKSMAAQRAYETTDDLSARAASTFLNRAAEKSKLKASVPLIARMTSATPEQFNGNNRPYIEIISLSGTQEQQAARRIFDRFILSAVSETSVEKMEVVETFGAPHVFANGRFVKKLNISGYVRNQAVNHNAVQTSQRVYDQDTLNRLSVPDSVSFRYFYDNYLRATQMASQGTVAQLYVDGDIYEGYFRGLSYSRDSNIEQTTQFSMEMFVLKDNNIDNATAQKSIAGIVDGITVKKTNFTTQQVANELKNAQGDLTLSLKYNSIDAGTIKDNGTDNIRVQAQTRLVAKGSSQILRVTCKNIPNFAGAALVYDDGGEVDGQAARITDTGTVIRFKVTNYSQLSDSIPGLGGPQTVAFKITADGGSSVTLNVTYTLSDLPQLILDHVVVRNAEGTAGVGTTVPAPFTAPAILGDFKSVFDATSKTTDLVIQYVFKDRDNKPVVIDPAAAILTPKLSAFPASKSSPTTQPKGLTPAEQADAKVVTPPQFTLFKTADLAQSTATFIGSLSITTDPTSNNSPFQAADGITVKAENGLTVSNRYIAKLPPIYIFIGHPGSRAFKGILKSAQLSTSKLNTTIVRKTIGGVASSVATTTFNILLLGSGERPATFASVEPTFLTDLANATATLTWAATTFVASATRTFEGTQFLAKLNGTAVLSIPGADANVINWTAGTPTIVGRATWGLSIPCTIEAVYLNNANLQSLGGNLSLASITVGDNSIIAPSPSILAPPQ